MEEILISIASKLAEYLVDPALREGQYLFCIGKITTSLQTEKENLKSILEGVEKRIEEAKTKVEKVDEAVMTWKNEVNEILIEVEDLQQQLQANNGCFRGWCPTWKRYSLCKQLAKKTKTMELLLNRKSNFVSFSHPRPLPEIESCHSDEKFLYFKSTKEAEHKLIEAFKDDSCYIIGLYGMGGSGKTSLSTQVGNKAKELRIFDHVIFTSISQNPQIRMIQDEIKDALGFKFEENSDSGRARRLSARMKSGERILIILDDVWKKHDFKEIGIPIKGEHHKGCKVLLTTRLQHVCTMMDCSTIIPLHLLSDEESWSLFIKHASIISGTFSSNSMKEVALGIVRECKGLPIAIVAVGASLKGKSDEEWKLALDDLRHSKPLDMDPGIRDAFTCLKLSYYYLRNEATKLILLLCSMFPEDYDIEVEYLFRYGIGLGICEKGESLDRARRRVNGAIKNLVESCLLTYSGEERKNLKMHDLVRDVVLWIAPKEKGTVFVNQQKMLLDELPQDEAVKDSFVISLWDLETINPIYFELNAPKLEILLLNLSFSCQKVNLLNSSFEGVKELKVLSINPHSNGSALLSLPQSTRWLTNLHTLRLRRMELGDISFVVVLRSLQILDLQHSELKELPNDIDKLNKLKLLDLSMCTIHEGCDEVIRRCSQLEELYVHGGGAGINSYETLEMNDGLLKLQSYVIHIGQVTHSCIYRRHYLPKRVLYTAEFNISNPSKITKALLQRVSVVCLQNLQGRCKSFIPEMVQAVGSMKELTELYLIDCDEIECLVDKTTPHELGLCLGKINLCNLKCIEINNCANLASLFPIFVAQNLMSLEEMRLSDCSMLKHMIRNEESGINTAQEISDDSFLGQHEEHQAHHSQFQIHNLFPLLKTFELENLPCFLKICEENYYPSWPSTMKQQLKPRTDVMNDKRMRDDVSTLPLSIFGLQHLQTL